LRPDEIARLRGNAEVYVQRGAQFRAQLVAIG
jgi:hypothetical protein